MLSNLHEIPFEVKYTKLHAKSCDYSLTFSKPFFPHVPEIMTKEGFNLSVEEDIVLDETNEERQPLLTPNRTV